MKLRYCWFCKYKCSMQCKAYKSLLTVEAQWKFLQRHYLSWKFKIGVQKGSNMKCISRVLTKRTDMVKPCQLIPINNDIILRHSSNWSLKKIYEKYIAGVELKGITEVTKKVKSREKELKAQQDENIHTTNLGDLIYGCSSSMHLLNLIFPYIEDNTLTLEVGVKTIKLLQNLVYKEILRMHPDLPYGSVWIIYKNLSLMKRVEAAFQEIHSHHSFQALKEFLAHRTHAMDYKQYSSSFSCLLSLNVSKYDPELRPFFLRLVNSGHEGFDFCDVLELFRISEHIASSTLTHKHVIPKLGYTLRTFASHSLDNNNFKALLANEGLSSINHQDWFLMYEMMYKTCNGTNCLDDVESAIQLLNLLTMKFDTSYMTEEDRNVYYKLYNKHKDGIIQKMSDMCIERIECNARNLMPFHFRSLSSLLSKRLLKTTFYKNAVERSSSFLNNNLQLLSMPELVWILSGLVPSDMHHIKPETEKEILNRFQVLDLANLCLVLDLVDVEILKELEILDIVLTKSLFYKKEVRYNSQLKFVSKIHSSYSISHPLLRDWKKALQHRLLHIYRNTYIGLLRQFHVDLLTFLPGLLPLSPSTFNILLPMAEDSSLYHSVPKLSLLRMMNSAQRSQLENHAQNHLSSFSDKEKSVYERVMFCIVSKSVVAFCRNISAAEVTPDMVFEVLYSLHSHQRMDYLLGIRLLDCIKGHDFSSPLTIQWLLKCGTFIAPQYTVGNEEFRKQAVNNVVDNILLNHCEIRRSDLMAHLNFLLHFKYELDEGSDLEDLLIKLLKEDLECDICVDSLELLLRCSLMNANVSNIMPSVFSVDSLNKIDKLIEEEVGTKDKMHHILFALNQEVCLRYSELGIPWLHNTDMAESIIGAEYYRRRIPSSLADEIEHIAGRSEFVGKEVFFDFAVPAWRAMLFDRDNTPVEFTAVNVNHADEMQLKKIVFVYACNQEDKLHWLEKRYKEHFIKKGWNVVEVHQHEWQSISISSSKHQEAFLREKIFHQSSSTESEGFHVNTDNMSEQWRSALNITS